PMAADNKSLGKFVLDGIPAAPRGIPQIEVTFDIDANGIINVTALDKATNRSQHITITASSGLSESEIQKMKQEAEVHAEEDMKRKELVENRNNADNAIYTAEKLIKENVEKIPAEIKKEVEDGVSEVKAVINNDDSESMKTATEKLQQTIQKVGASMYQQTGTPPTDGPTDGTEGAAGTGDAGSAPGADAGDVVDGEFKAV
ncbi:MAG: Hsp70 family protein, partial [Anaerolineaceae bacterium]|nr:Hsp70 family protein [Anaerolineaceae bacterium]